MIVTYLKTEIRVASDTDRCSAFATIDGELRVFLGGLAEAKTFLRERKNGPHYGPRVASYRVTLVDSGSISTTWRRDVAVSEVAYWAREGRRATVTRIEHCPTPGCDGDGRVLTPATARQRHGTERPCACHVASVETVETVESL